MIYLIINYKGYKPFIKDFYDAYTMNRYVEEVLNSTYKRIDENFYYTVVEGVRRYE